MTRLLHPRYWGYHLVVVVALVAAGLLGPWQYHGWQERRTAEVRDLTQVAPIPLADAIGPDDPFPGEYVGAARRGGRHLGARLHRLRVRS